MERRSTFHNSVSLIAVLIFSMPFITLAQQNRNMTDAKPATAVLLVGDYAGINEVDVQSGALLVAVELRKHGIAVNDPIYEASSTLANVYRISFRPLGEKILVHLTQEIPMGTIIIERQIWITNIEEIIQAAPRLVDALVHKKPIASNVDVESVVGGDTPVIRKIAGESLWTLGLFGTSVPGTNLMGELGFEVGLSYERPSYAIETEFRLTGGEASGGDSFVFGSWSIGGRYFFNKRNISPYLGGGLGLVGTSYQEKAERSLFQVEWALDDSDTKDWDDDSDIEDLEGDSGLGVYIIGGIEMLRLSSNRLKLELRVDRPFFSLPSQDIMPITIGLFYSRTYDLLGGTGGWGTPLF